MENFREAILFSIVLLGTPGPAVISLLHSGINYGFLRTLPFFLGLIFGFLINLLSSATFLVSAFYISPRLYLFLQVIALGYLFYLAYKIAFGSVLSGNRKTSLFRFKHGLFLNLVNPKAYIAGFTSLSQFSDQNNLVFSLFLLILLNISIAVLLQGIWILVGDKISFLFKHHLLNQVVNICLAVMMVLAVLSTYFKVYL